MWVLFTLHREPLAFFPQLLTFLVQKIPFTQKSNVGVSFDKGKIFTALSTKGTCCRLYIVLRVTCLNSIWRWPSIPQLQFCSCYFPVLGWIGRGFSSSFWIHATPLGHVYIIGCLDLIQTFSTCKKHDLKFTRGMRISYPGSDGGGGGVCITIINYYWIVLLHSSINIILR